MGVLRDYIAYAREHVHPKLTDEAQQKLIQCYVDMRKIGSGRGQISAYPRKYSQVLMYYFVGSGYIFDQAVWPTSL